MFTNRKSPISSVFSMLPEGIRNASTRKVRSRNQITSATLMDLVHSQSQRAAEGAGASTGALAGAGVDEGAGVTVTVFLTVDGRDRACNR